MGIATQLTLLRIAFIPFFIIAFYWQSPWSYVLSAGIYSIAAITDWLDGYLARKLQQESPFGAFLDPVADKLIVITALILIAVRHQDIVITLLVVAMLMREVIVTSLRQWMAQLQLQDNVQVSQIGKWKTRLQITSIIVLLLFNEEVYPLFYTLGVALLIIATVLALWSMALYLKQSSPSFK